jgi:hypothetical protein
MVSSIAEEVISNPPNPSDRDAAMRGRRPLAILIWHALRENAPMKVKGLQIPRRDAGWRNYQIH